MLRELAIRSVVIIIPRIGTVWVIAYVCTKEIYRPQRGSNPVPPGSKSTTLPMRYPAPCRDSLEALQEPCRCPGGGRPIYVTLYGHRTGPVRDTYGHRPSGARANCDLSITFKLELKVTRGPRGVKTWTAPSRGPSGSRAGRPKNGQRQPENCPGRPHL